MRILVTNDDGIDSVGLHKLALAIRHLGEVVVVAPDTEYSGAGCAVGAFNKLNPEVHRVRLEGIDEAWTVSGPPALCVIFARAGLFVPCTTREPSGRASRPGTPASPGSL